MADYDDDTDFFEEDEPAEKILSAFDHGEKGLTSPPWPVRFCFVGQSENTAVDSMPLSAQWVSAGSDDQNQNTAVAIPVEGSGPPGRQGHE